MSARIRRPCAASAPAAMPASERVGEFRAERAARHLHVVAERRGQDRRVALAQRGHEIVGWPERLGGASSAARCRSSSR